MVELDARKFMSASSVASTALAGGTRAARLARELSPAALAAAAEQTLSAYSPIVVAGFVRAIECILVAIIGTLVYCVYVLPTNPFDWIYPIAIIGIAALTLVAFQAADIYQIHAFRRPTNQMARLVSAWSIVFLIATAVSFFGKLDASFSRVWLVTFTASDCLLCWASVWCSTRWSGAGCGKAG